MVVIFRFKKFKYSKADVRVGDLVTQIAEISL